MDRLGNVFVQLSADRFGARPDRLFHSQHHSSLSRSLLLTAGATHDDLGCRGSSLPGIKTLDLTSGVSESTELLQRNSYCFSQGQSFLAIFRY